MLKIPTSLAWRIRFIKQPDPGSRYRLNVFTVWKIVRKAMSWNLSPGVSRPHWTRNGFVGASCFLYIRPAISYFQLAGLHSDPFAYGLTQCLSLSYVGVAVVSFLADYVHIPTLSLSEAEDWYSSDRRNERYPPSVWGHRDRIISLTVALLSVLECYLRLGLLASLCAVFICLACNLYSRRARSRSSWVIRHSFWHFISSTALFVLASIYWYISGFK